MKKDSGKRERPKAKFRVTKVTNIETRPWKCPGCGTRCRTLTALRSHVKTHPMKNTLPLDILPTAGPGKILPPPKKKTGLSQKVVLKKGREKGQNAETRLRDPKKMKKEIRAYERALNEGETAEEYKARTGVGKQNINRWRGIYKKHQNDKEK